MDEMSWLEIKEVLSKTNVVVVPFGSTEEHGMHLPVNVDSFSATYIANHAAEKVVAENNVSVMVAPTVHYTDVAVHKMFPGTIGIKPQTLVNVIYDIVTGFLEQGFNNIIVFIKAFQTTILINLGYFKRGWHQFFKYTSIVLFWYYFYIRQLVMNPSPPKMVSLIMNL